VKGSMSFWQKLFVADQQQNEHKNQIACIENDCSCKSKGIKKVLVSRGFSKKELTQLQHPPIQ